VGQNWDKKFALFEVYLISKSAFLHAAQKHQPGSQSYLFVLESSGLNHDML
jgi:hypothetical protein